MANPLEEPFAEESDLFHFVTQETRYLIVQYILAHPENLPSLTELDDAIPKGKSTIHEHLRKLQDRGIVDAYELDPEKRSRDLPSTFYGLTEYGIYVAGELDLLEAKGMLQAIYANADKSEEIRRYEAAPRPERKSEDELRAELDDLTGDETASDPSAGRKVVGITNLLGRDADTGASVRLALGTGILDLLHSDSSEDRGAALSALAGIARADHEVVVPVLPKLADVVDTLDLTRLTEAVEVVRLVSGTDPEAVPESVRDALLGVFDRDRTFWQEDFERAREAIEVGLSIGESLSVSRLQATCHERLGDVSRPLGRLEDAESNYRDSLALYREIGDRAGEARALRGLGVVFDRRGNLDEAASHLRESLEIARTAGDRASEAATLRRLGNVVRTRGEYDTAEEYYQQSLDIFREIGDRSGEARSLGSLGNIALQRGDFDTAEEYHQQSLDIFREIGDRSGEAKSLHSLGNIARNRSDFDTAEEYHQQSLDIEREIGDRSGEAKSLHSLGNIALQRGDFDTAEAYHQQSLDRFREIGDRAGKAKSLGNLGLVAERRGDHGSAVEMMSDAYRMFADLGATREAVQSAENLGRIASERGDTRKAVEWIDQGLELVDESSLDLPEVSERLREARQMIVEPSEPPIEAVYDGALRAAATGEESATALFREAWDRRGEVEPDSEEYSLALSAGVGLLAEVTILDIEEMADAEENIAEVIGSDRDRLTDAARELFDYLTRDGSDSDGTPDALTDVPTVEEAETLAEWEATAYAALLDRLQKPDTTLPRYEPGASDGPVGPGSGLSPV